MAGLGPKRGSGIVIRREVGIDEMPDRGESPSVAAEAAEEIQRAEKTSKIIYTSASGVKVLSTPRDKWLAGIAR
ncbi:MAG: hypothetical protein GXX96_38615 [Planctomycetaceae bacterium]|jgi:hypothetical protein|nr:hypothetical protein [Planctomycetaceae bacterium]